jgi:hypothetical protein
MLALLAIGVLPWLFPFVRSFKFGDYEVTLRSDVEELKGKVDTIERDALLPGRGEPKSVRPRPRRARASSAPPSDAKPLADWDSDPNKGHFGGSRTSNGRELRASITPVAGTDSAACRVHLSVVSIDKNKPLAGTVVFHLHPTFRRYREYEVDVVDGVAEDTITSWGAFTVGAEADEGKTRLELDLMEVPGSTRKFREQ